MFIKLLFLAAFTVVMLSVGLYSRRKIKTQQDFLFGGRQMGPWLTAFAYGTTYFSAVIMVG
jgi:SSS family solute:Na+ symporter